MLRKALSVARFSRASATSSAAHAQELLAEANEALQSSLTPTHVERLQRDGYAVVDGVLGTRVCAQLRLEILGLRARGLMTENRSLFITSGETRSLAKTGILEAEAQSLSASDAPLFSLLARDRTLLTLLNTFRQASREESLHYQALKLQHNAGGCFPLHSDSHAMTDSRRVTALFYLNPSWSRKDEGHLVLYPFPERRRCIEPLNDRLVLFSSPDMVHRVEPSRAPRVCFTAWFFARGGPPRDAPLPREASRASAATLAAFCSPELRKHVAKAVLVEEWEHSLRDAHPPSAELDSVIQSLHSDVAVIEASLARRFTGSQELLAVLRAQHAMHNKA
jgi:hypothetical protein